MTKQEQFKQAMGRFATGVCVVTFENPISGEPDGITISAFSSLSLDPLKVLFCLGHWGRNKENFSQVTNFTINILNSEQTDLAYQFAGHNREQLAEKWTNINALPAIKDALVSIVCQKGNQYSEGDHDIIIGEVLDITLNDEQLNPLLYYKSNIISGWRDE